MSRLGSVLVIESKEDFKITCSGRYPGCIAHVDNEEELCRVAYDDGDFELGILLKASNIRKISTKVTVPAAPRMSLHFKA